MSSSSDQEITEIGDVVVPRELLPNSSYAPLKGIFDLGWRAWQDLPASDFVRQLRKMDDGLIRENREWIFQLAPLIANSELSLEQFRAFLPGYFKLVDRFAITIVKNVFGVLKNREVRDIILRHAAEENGHSELFADFCSGALRLDRARELWMPADAKKAGNETSGWYDKPGAALAKSNPELAYALIPFTERSLPRQHEILAVALRKVYGFKSKDLAFFDLHRFVDIYHERFGLWVLGKYATKKSSQELVSEAVQSMRAGQIKWARGAYDTIMRM